MNKYLIPFVLILSTSTTFGSVFAAESSTSSPIVAVYDVYPGKKIELDSGKDDQKYRDVWNKIAPLIPNSLADKYVESFQVYLDEKGDSDAYVDDADENGKWRIVINYPLLTSNDPSEMSRILVHEITHILSLNKSQVNPRVYNCRTIEIGEGCVLNRSALYKFYKKFWDGFDPEDSQDYDENAFVTEYASTEFIEDFADTFSFFVMKNDITHLDTSIKSQKIKFFQSIPAYAAMRIEIRKQLGLK